MKRFDKEIPGYGEQFQNPQWITEDENYAESLKAKVEQLTWDNTLSIGMIRAKTLELLAKEAPVAVTPGDIFQDKLYSGNLMIWQHSQISGPVAQKVASEKRYIPDSWGKYGLLKAGQDFGHTSPNSELLLNVGVGGLYQRLETYGSRPGLTEKQLQYYESGKVTLKAVETVILRLAEAIRPYDEENYRALKNVAWNAPQNSYEAMQLLIVYFFIHEYVCGTRVRTLGRLDVLLQPFYARDLKNGTFTKEEIVEMLKFFLYKFWLAKVPYDLPFAIGGMGVDGEDVTNEMSWMIVEAYDSLNIYSPKIHVKVCKKTPADFVKRVLRCIRGGNSSFVFINDEVGIKALMDVGITEKEARNFVPIGCYEPAVWGVEMGCTGNGGVSLPKMVELVMTGGVDLRSGDQLGVSVGPVNSFRDFVAEIKKQLTYFTEYALEHVTEIEKRYDQMHADPLLSAQYDHSVETGVDVHTGGAKYNNSSLYFYSIGSLIDSMEAVRELVFEKKLVSYEQLCEIVKNNWEGHENLRTYALMKCPKYGNHIAETDALTKEMTDFAAGLVNNKPNGRGGVFKAALFTIDFCFHMGKRTMATPDGRLAGEPLSKNLCATVGMDKKGITSLIHSVTQIDHSKFPNGSVLDILLHPTAVAGEEGLEAFYGILMTYFAKGGFGIHGNVFDVDTLRDAQKNPDKYRNLQVRLCGWNVYFVNLSKEEQDSFIAQAK